MQLKGKCAIVIGGAQGIGQAYCEALLKKGAKVYMGDIQEEKGKLAAEEFEKEFGAESIYFCKVDVTKTEDIKQIFDKAKETFGQLDIAVGNAAVIDEIDWEKCVDINLMGTLRITAEALKCMGKDKGSNGGAIVHTASIQGLRPVDWQPVYCATKHGVIAHCRSMAMPRQFNNHGVRINCICPTSVKTPLWSQVKRAYFVEVEEEHLKHVDPLMPSDIADALIQLLEDDSYNGAAMRVTKKYGRDLAEFSDSAQDLQ